MKVLKTKISNIDILVQVEDETYSNDIVYIDDDENIVNDDIETNILETPQRIIGGSKKKDNEKRNTIGNKSLNSALKTAFAIADIFDQQYKERDNSPDEVNIEYSLAFNAGGNAWMITCGATAAIKINMKWKKDN